VGQVDAVAVCQTEINQYESLTSERPSNKLESAVGLRRLFSISRLIQACFVLSVLIYWFIFAAPVFAEGTFMEELTDALGIGSLLFGGLLHLWAVSYGRTGAALRQTMTTQLIIGGPYAYIRYPLEVANFLLGVGMIFLLDALPFVIVLLAIVALHYGNIIPAQEEFLKKRFGHSFVAYYRAVPKFIPLVLPREGFSLGRHLRLREVSSVWALILIASFFEWIESPPHRTLILDFCHWLRP
jgi:protein-S-isoprenylcysteine O-methyltransferase Ste14